MYFQKGPGCQAACRFYTSEHEQAEVPSPLWEFPAPVQVYTTEYTYVNFTWQRPEAPENQDGSSVYLIYSMFCLDVTNPEWSKLTMVSCFLFYCSERL